MAAETPTGEPATAYDLALRNAERIRGLAQLVEYAHCHARALDSAGDGLIQLLKDAAEAAEELLEVVRRKKDLAAEKDGGNNG